MPLEDILNKITENASSKAKDIEDNAKAKAQDIIKKAEEETHQIRQRIVRQESQRLCEISHRDIVSAKLKAKGEVLERKRREVDLCFDKALDSLINLEDELYRHVIANMLVAVGSLGKAEIVFSFNDKSRINAEFIHKINPNFTVTFSNELKGGFILKSKEVMLDNSFERVLSSMRQDWEPKVAQVLFKE